MDFSRCAEAIQAGSFRGWNRGYENWKTLRTKPLRCWKQRADFL